MHDAAVELEPEGAGRRRRKKLSGRTKVEVLGKLRALHRQLDAGLPAPDGRLTVSTFLDRWLVSTLAGHVADSTADDYADTVRLHLRPALGERVLSKLTVADVDALWAAKRAAGYSPNSIRIMRALLRKALGQAEREGLLVRNVAALSTPPRIRAPEGRTLAPSQARQLLDAIAGHRLEALVIFLLAFGMRRGEALGLRWSGVNWDAATIAVTHGVKRIKAGAGSERRTRVAIGELKNRRSRRTLYLTPQLLELLRRHEARQTAERAAAGPAWQEHGLIFASEVGTPLDPDNFSHTFSRLCLSAGLGHWHPHELRHSGASLMLAQGTPLHVVSGVLGHASITVTKDVYGHLVEDQHRAASAAMTGLLWAREPDTHHG